MIETIVFILFLLAILFVAMGPRPPKKKKEDEPTDKKGPDSTEG